MAAIAAKYTGKRPRPLAVQIRDRLGEWMGDEDFAAAFGTRGRPGWSPSRLALVTVLQRGRISVYLMYSFATLLVLLFFIR